MLTVHALSEEVEFERFKVPNKGVERSIHELESQESVGSRSSSNNRQFILFEFTLSLHDMMSVVTLEVVEEDRYT